MAMRHQGTTENGRNFTYDMGVRGAPGQGLRIGNDYCLACPFCRKIVRIYGANNESAKIRAELLRAINWVQMTKSIWLCDECEKDPFARQSVADGSVLPQASRPSLGAMAGLPAPGPGMPPGFGLPPGFQQAMGAPVFQQGAPPAGYVPPQPPPGYLPAQQQPPPQFVAAPQAPAPAAPPVYPAPPPQYQQQPPPQQQPQYPPPAPQQQYQAPPQAAPQQPQAPAYQPPPAPPQRPAHHRQRIGDWRAHGSGAPVPQAPQPQYAPAPTAFTQQQPAPHHNGHQPDFGRAMAVASGAPGAPQAALGAGPAHATLPAATEEPPNVPMAPRLPTQQ
jgi:hypothetical protein